MADPVVELQRALIAALRQDPVVAELLDDRIYDIAPAEATHPFVEVARMEAAPDDTDEILGFEITVGLAIHDLPDGENETLTTRNVKVISGAIYNVLHRNAGGVSVAGHRLRDLLFQTSSAEPRGGDGVAINRLAYVARLSR